MKNMTNKTTQGASQECSGGPRIAFKITEVAKMAGVSPITIRRHIKRGLFNPIRTFGAWLIPAVQVEAWLTPK